MIVKNKIFMDFLAKVSEYPDLVGIGEINEFSINNYGESVLHLAACQGRVDIIERLIDDGVDINKKGEHGYTPLHEAIEQGNYLAALYLIKRGADLMVKNDFGMSPLDILDLSQD